MMNTARMLQAADQDESQTGSISEDYIAEWFRNSKYSKMKYADLMNRIYPSSQEQERYFDALLGKYNPGNIHALIARLAKDGIIRAVITTNFDNLIERAIESVGLSTQIVTENSAKDIEPLIQCNKFRIYKPHGNLGNGKLRNTPKDLLQIDKCMERELIDIFDTHGVIVVGYSGRDPGMQKVFQKSRRCYYPIYWINPEKPAHEIGVILEKKQYIYIHCVNASQFITDFYQLKNRLEIDTNKMIVFPSVENIVDAIQNGKLYKPLYLDFLDGIISELQSIRAQFQNSTSKTAFHHDIYQFQLLGKEIIHKFIHAMLVACRYDKSDLLFETYDFFGKAMAFYYPSPDSVEGVKYSDENIFIFLVHGMFVSFIGMLVKYNYWEILGRMLNQPLFVDVAHVNKSVSYREINRPINHTFERNETSWEEALQELFEDHKLNRILSIKEIVDAELFLFIRSVQEGFCWYPRTGRLACWGFTLLKKSEYKSFAKRFLAALSIEDDFTQYTYLFDNCKKRFEKEFDTYSCGHLPFDNSIISVFNTK